MARNPSDNQPRLAAPDELHLIVGSVVLGGGTPLFGPALSAPLRPVETQRWNGSKNVLVRYATTDSAS